MVGRSGSPVGGEGCGNSTPGHPDSGGNCRILDCIFPNDRSCDRISRRVSPAGGDEGTGSPGRGRGCKPGRDGDRERPEIGDGFGIRVHASRKFAAVRDSTPMGIARASRCGLTSWSGWPTRRRRRGATGAPTGAGCSAPRSGTGEGASPRSRGSRRSRPAPWRRDGSWIPRSMTPKRARQGPVFETGPRLLPDPSK